MPKYTLSFLQSLYFPKNITLTKNNDEEAKRLLVPPSNSVRIYDVLTDILHYLGIASSSTNLSSTTTSSSITISPTAPGTSVTLLSASTTNAGLLSAQDKQVLDALVTLSGTPSASLNLGAFSGTVIDDNSTIKQALQALETALETFTLNFDEAVQDNVASFLNAGSNIALSYDDNLNTLTISATGSASSGYDTIQTQGTPLPQQNNLNFGDSRFSVTNDTPNSRTNITLSIPISSLSDVSLSSPSNNQVLRYNGSNWVNATISTLPVANNAGEFVYFNGFAYTLVRQDKNVQINNTSNLVSLPYTPVIGSQLLVFINGVLKMEGEDYTVSSNNITFAYNLLATDKVTSYYYY